MSVVINIKGTPITFPSTGESPNWAPAVIEFAQATEDAIQSAVGPYDVAPTVIDLTAAYIGTSTSVTELQFSVSAIRSVVINYSIILNKAVGTDSESGVVYLLFDNNNSPKWSVSRDYIGETYSNFTVTDEGLFKIDISGSHGYTSGKFGFSAKALEQS